MAAALPFRVIPLPGPLYRHNDKPAGTLDTTLMSSLYTNQTKPTYFLVNPVHLNEYAGHFGEGAKGKRFELLAGQEAHLLDMSDYDTVAWIKSQATPIEKESLDIAFPVRLIWASNGSVRIVKNQRRLSSTNTKHHDDKAIAAICRIISNVINPTYGIMLDGYYSAQQFDNASQSTFHSEVGLCPHAFPKFVVTDSIKSKVPPKHGPGQGIGARESRFRPDEGGGAGGAARSLFDFEDEDEGGGGGGGGLARSLFGSEDEGGGGGGLVRSLFGSEGGRRRRTRRRSGKKTKRRVRR